MSIPGSARRPECFELEREPGQTHPPGMAWALTCKCLGIPAVGSWINTPGSHKIKED